MAIALAFLLTFLLSSCAPASLASPPTPSSLSSATATATPRSTASSLPTATGTARDGNLARVARVVDGDTISAVIAVKAEPVRIIGIDTPEVVDQRKPVQCFGREASAKARELLENESVRLVEDPTQANRDKYDRLLRYVQKRDGIDFGLWMIGNGYAHEYTYRVPYQRQAAYKAAQASARQQGLGLWSPNTCNGSR